LLQYEDHSVYSIMSETLISRDYEQAGIMSLMFTNAQAAQMRERLRGTSRLLVTQAKPSLASSGPDPQLIVRMYSFPGISTWLIGAAESEASRVLQGANVELTWVDCATVGLSDFCAGPQLPTELVVRIIPKALPQASKTALGMATSSEPSAAAFIFFDRVVAVRTHARLLPTILGRVVAHEIVHLLWPKEGHSELGLMRGQWSADDLAMTNSGCLKLPTRSMRSMQTEALRTALFANTSPEMR
jgi:hypothetical protein